MKFFKRAYLLICLLLVITSSAFSDDDKKQITLTSDVLDKDGYIFENAILTVPTSLTLAKPLEITNSEIQGQLNAEDTASFSSMMHERKALKNGKYDYYVGESVCVPTDGDELMLYQSDGLPMIKAGKSFKGKALIITKDVKLTSLIFMLPLLPNTKCMHFQSGESDSGYITFEQIFLSVDKSRSEIPDRLEIRPSIYPVPAKRSQTSNRQDAVADDIATPLDYQASSSDHVTEESLTEKLKNSELSSTENQTPSPIINVDATEEKQPLNPEELSQELSGIHEEVVGIRKELNELNNLLSVTTEEITTETKPEPEEGAHASQLSQANNLAEQEETAKSVIASESNPVKPTPAEKNIFLPTEAQKKFEEAIENASKTRPTSTQQLTPEAPTYDATTSSLKTGNQLGSGSEASQTNSEITPSFVFQGQPSRRRWLREPSPANATPPVNRQQHGLNSETYHKFAATPRSQSMNGNKVKPKQLLRQPEHNVSSAVRSQEEQCNRRKETGQVCQKTLMSTRLSIWNNLINTSKVEVAKAANPREHFQKTKNEGSPQLTGIQFLLDREHSKAEKEALIPTSNSQK